MKSSTATVMFVMFVTLSMLAIAPRVSAQSQTPVQPTCLCPDGTVLACPGCEGTRFCGCPDGTTGQVSPPPVAQPVARPVAQPLARPVAQPLARPVAGQPEMVRSPVRLWGGVAMAGVGGLYGLDALTAYNTCSSFDDDLAGFSTGVQGVCGGLLTRALIGFGIAGGGAWLAMNSMVPAPLSNVTFQPTREGFAVHKTFSW